METTVYSKPTDAHLYLNANSSHPKSQILGIAKGVTLRLRRICSRDVDFWEKSRIYMKYLTDCGHDSAHVNRAFEAVGAMTREEARTSRRKVRRDSYVFVTKFNPRAPDIRKIFRKRRSVLDSDEQAKKILPEGAILVSYKRNATLKELLAPSNPYKSSCYKYDGPTYNFSSICRALYGTPSFPLPIRRPFKILKEILLKTFQKNLNSILTRITFVPYLRVPIR